MKPVVPCSERNAHVDPRFQRPLGAAGDPLRRRRRRPWGAATPRAQVGPGRRHGFRRLRIDRRGRLARQGRAACGARHRAAGRGAAAGGDGRIGLPPAPDAGLDARTGRLPAARLAGAASALHPALAGRAGRLVHRHRRCGASADRGVRHPVPHRRHPVARHPARTGSSSAHPGHQGLRRRRAQDRSPAGRRPPAGAGRRGRADLRHAGCGRRGSHRGQRAPGHAALRPPDSPATRRPAGRGARGLARAGAAGRRRVCRAQPGAHQGAAGASG